MKKSALVVGGGAFGTSIASILSETFYEVILHVRSEDVYNAINSGENSFYLPGQKLSKNIKAILNLNDLNKKNIQLVVNGLPTSAITSYFECNHDFFADFFERRVPFVSLSKGIDVDTLELPDDLFADIFPRYLDLITYLSGPSFAKEIVEKQITIVALAGKDPKILIEISNLIKTSYFRCIPTYDIKGVLLGGALKNILAIAGGILEGLGYNHNTRAALITRGITEMLRFGKVLNARPETFYGFAGMGDLILTTTSSLSRNKSFGLEIAKGRKAEEIIASQRSVVEGYKTSEAAFKMAKKYKIKTRLFNAIYEILYLDKKCEDVLNELMSFSVSTVE